MKKAAYYPFEHDPVPDSCWSLTTGPDGRVYAASCCESVPGGGVRIVRYDDASDSLQTLVNVPEAVGEPADSGRASQCKIHYSFAASEGDGMLYAATHLSAPAIGQKGYSPWADWKDPHRAFPFSALLAYDTRRDEVAWSAEFIPREGCRCLALDAERGRLYAIGYPRDHFYAYDIETRRLRDLGRLGSVNAQAIFTDRRGRAYTSNCSGQLVRYDPDADRLEELPVFVPHNPSLSGWHGVFYDVVASPAGDCVYGVPWNVDPHLFRYWPDDGPHGRMEDLGAVHQRRDLTQPISFYLDHCGGLVFGADGGLYYAVTRWPEGAERGPTSKVPGGLQAVVVRMDPETLERDDYARLDCGGWGHYVSRAGRDRYGNLFFGHVNRPTPVGLSRLPMNAAGDNLHRPLRTWG